MGKAIFSAEFNALHEEKGASVRVLPAAEPQLQPEWVIAQAEAAGIATRVPGETAAEPAPIEG